MKTILVPTDFSKHAKTAMKFAIQFAEISKAKLVFFHSAWVPASGRLLQLPERARRQLDISYAHQKEAQLEADLEELYDQLSLNRDGRQSEVFVKTGLLVVEEIIAAARKVKANMIITGTHGATGMEKLFGSNTSVLISKSDFPVMAIPRKYRYRPIRKILYASDLKDTSAQLFQFLPLVKNFNPRIDILNVSYQEQAGDEKIFQFLLKKINYTNFRLLRLERQPGETLFHQLHEYVNLHRPDLLVMFPEERNFFEKIFNGSKTEKMSYDLKMPLLAIKND